ncbi:MAG: protein kinase domain-containing protein, partial [Terriglobales bacterium]
TTLTQTGQIIGSPLYMSPEQALGKPIDARTDIYSSGCVLFHALTGAPPIEGANSIETLFKHTMEVPPSLTDASIGTTFPKELEKIAATALQKDPDRRQQSFDQLRSQLAAVRLPAAGDSSGERSSPAKVERTPYTVIDPKAVDLHLSRSGRSGFNFRLALCGCITAVVMIVALAAYILLGAHETVKGDGQSSGIAGSEKISLDPPDPDVQLLNQGMGSQHSGFANVIIDQDINFHHKTFNLNDKNFGDDAMIYLVKRLKEKNYSVELLDLNGSSVGDRGVAALQHLPLTGLWLDHSNVTGAGLQTISRMQTLTDLHIANLRLQSKDVQCLQNLKHLKKLDMSISFEYSEPRM